MLTAKLKELVALRDKLDGCDDDDARDDFMLAALQAIPDLSALLSALDSERAINAKLRESLQEAMKWVENAPKDAWGYVDFDHCLYRWPLRDELASKLRAALAEEKV